MTAHDLKGHMYPNPVEMTDLAGKAFQRPEAGWQKVHPGSFGEVYTTFVKQLHSTRFLGFRSIQVNARFASLGAIPQHRVRSMPAPNFVRETREACAKMGYAKKGKDLWKMLLGHPSVCR